MIYTGEMYNKVRNSINLTFKLDYGLANLTRLLQPNAGASIDAFWLSLQSASHAGSNPVKETILE